MSKHTPGPWTNDGQNSEGVFIVNSSRGRVAEIPCLYHVLEKSRGDRAVSAECDARLIAAAPEMLQALRIAVRRLEEIRYQKASDKQIEFLNQIIAKAEGREHHD